MANQASSGPPGKTLAELSCHLHCSPFLCLCIFNPFLLCLHCRAGISFHACGLTLTSFRASLQPVSLPPAVTSFLVAFILFWLSGQVTQRGLKQKTCIFSQFWRLQDPWEGGGGRGFCDSLKGSLSFPRALAHACRDRLQHRSSVSRTGSAMSSLKRLLEVLGSVTNSKVLSSKRASATCLGHFHEMHHVGSRHCEKNAGCCQLPCNNANLFPSSHVGVRPVTSS